MQLEDWAVLVWYAVIAIAAVVAVVTLIVDLDTFGI
jgi:hypothetical protein